MTKQKKNLKELRTELVEKNIAYPKNAKRADLEVLLAGGQPPQAEPVGPAIPDEVPQEPEIQKGVFCKHCNRNHEKTFDNAGINHEKFDVGGKAEVMFDYLCGEPKVMTFIPLDPGDIPGTLSGVAQFTRNGLRINVRKDTQVEVPKDIADSIKESQEATRKAYRVRTENLNVPGTYIDARTDLMSEQRRTILDA